jgi:hypothetical protein
MASNIDKVEEKVEEDVEEAIKASWYCHNNLFMLYAIHL